MPKPTISRAELKTLLESIVHWCRDIKVPLMRGKNRTVVRGSMFTLPYWNDTKQRLPVGDLDCPLCDFQEKSCLSCILNLFYDKDCTTGGSHWNLFCCAPSLTTCNAMIAAMVEVVKNVEVEK